ncbi:MAG: putative porin, partial [Chitinophagales bacterium]
MILCCGFVIAQDETINETQKYQYKDSPYQWHEIDTGMYNFEHYNFNQTDGWEYYDIGNSGLAQYSMTFEPNRKQGFQAGFSGFERYQYTIDKIKYYQIAKPFSEISYTMGTKRENIFQGRLAQNIKNRLEFGVDFMRLSSLGIFEGQRTRNSGFSLYSMIHSKNNRYHFGVDIAYNRVKATENGGIVEDFVDNDSIQYGNPLFYTSQLGEDAVTEQNNIDVLFSNHYDVGFSQIDSINDTVAVKRYYATWRFSQELGIERERYHFLDENPDSSFYGEFFQIADSAVYDMEFRTITNGIGISYLGAKEKVDTIEYRHFAANGFIRSQHVKLKERSFDEVDFKTQNVFVEGNFYANPLRESSLFYQAKAIYYLAGYNQHDLHLSGDIGWEMNKWGNVSASASFHNVSPTWIESFYFRKGALWSNEYKKTKSLQFAVQYQLPKYKASIGFSYSLVDK